MLKKRCVILLTTIVLGVGLSPLRAQSYREEADRFLRETPEGLQDRQCRAIVEAMQGNPEPLRQVRNARNAACPEDRRVEVRQVSRTLRLYRPRAGKEVLPLLVYFHGGGWTFGSLNSCARFCMQLAAGSKVCVLAVDYRLAPEYPYPCGLKDCMEAYRYACSQAEAWGCSPDQVSLGGDSSGGNLALAATLGLQETDAVKPHALVLFYPVVSAWNDGSASWRNHVRGAALDGEIMEAFNRAYCRGVNGSINEDARTNPLVSPSVAPDSLLACMPPVLLVAAERDILHDQGRDFARRLEGLGVDVRRQVLEGSVHLFITVDGQERAFRKAVQLTEDFLSPACQEKG